jgi:hypothetical protein
VLKDVVESENLSHRQSIRMAPNDVTPDEEGEFVRPLYPPKSHLKYKSDKGDEVRIVKYKHVFQDAYLPNWKDEV